MNEHRREFEFFVDAKRYASTSESLTGLDIKKQANVPLTYQLFEEREGDNPDIAISDGQAVDLAGKIKHFYAVPPATFGFSTYQ